MLRLHSGQHEVLYVSAMPDWQAEAFSICPLNFPLSNLCKCMNRIWHTLEQVVKGTKRSTLASRRFWGHRCRVNAWWTHHARPSWVEQLFKFPTNL